jgi:hypothetical protein
MEMKYEIGTAYFGELLNIFNNVKLKYESENFDYFGNFKIKLIDELEDIITISSKDISFSAFQYKHNTYIIKGNKILHINNIKYFSYTILKI